jgi:hypothetical protein
MSDSECRVYQPSLPTSALIGALNLYLKMTKQNDRLAVRLSVAHKKAAV